MGLFSTITLLLLSVNQRLSSMTTFLDFAR